MLENNKLYRGDCMEYLKEIGDNTVDLIICDLPYAMTKNKWDEIIPMEDYIVIEEKVRGKIKKVNYTLDKYLMREYKKGNGYKESIEFFNKHKIKGLWKEYLRVAKDNAPIILFGNQPFTSSLLTEESTKYFREELVWLKNGSGSGILAKKRHLRVHENILLFSKEGKYTYNYEKWSLEDDEQDFLTKRKTFKEYTAYNNNYGHIKDIKKEDDGTRFPISILSYKKPFRMSKNKKYDSKVDVNIHPTQKPLALIEYLVRTYSNEGDVVLDNCVGSGTTAQACINNKRNFIGMEKDDEIYEKAIKRIGEEYRG